MNNNHREIAEKLRDRITGVFSRKEIEANAITAALDDAWKAGHNDGDKAGFERGVRQGEIKAMEWYNGTCYYTQKDAKRALSATILALIAPPVPVWQHNAGCPTPYQWEKIDNYAGMGWVSNNENGRLTLKKTACFCDGCGLLKPVTKGE